MIYRGKNGQLFSVKISVNLLVYSLKPKILSTATISSVAIDGVVMKNNVRNVSIICFIFHLRMIILLK